MLKSDFHMHSNYDTGKIVLPYKFPELIKYCAKSRYEVLSITNHDKLFYNSSLHDYAKKHGILLIPGCERTIEGKHVLLINIAAELLNKIKTFDDLEKHKGENMVVIAPHPYYPWFNALHSKLEENINLFDAIEYSHFYLSYINFNKKAKEIAKKHGLPLVGTSDVHDLSQLNYTYTLLDCNKKVDDVLEAIRKNQLKLKTKPVSTRGIANILFKMTISNRFKKIL